MKEKECCKIYLESKRNIKDYIIYLFKNRKNPEMVCSGCGQLFIPELLFPELIQQKKF